MDDTNELSIGTEPQTERQMRDLARQREAAARAFARERALVAKALAAKTESARHGAGQLSLSAQRAPTREACDDGWSRVEAIVAGAEATARAVRSVAAELEVLAPNSAAARSANRAALRAETAAHAARRLVATRNHAYTFHTDSGFSFGEGWYLAAAAVLAQVMIQVEPGKAGTAQAETFLRELGLGAQLQPYRSRPRAMKHTTAIIGNRFRADPVEAQLRLRAAFLGGAPTPLAVSAWVDRRLQGACAGRKVLLWIRDGSHHPGRNTRYDELIELAHRVERAGLVPILTGDALLGGALPARAVDLILFWKDPIFRGADMRRAQLQFFEHLKAAHGVVGQIGVTTAGMDGPALLGLPTLYLTDAPNVRMREWVGAVPGYQELVREIGYLECASRVFDAWANA